MIVVALKYASTMEIFLFIYFLLIMININILINMFRSHFNTKSKEKK